MITYLLGKSSTNKFRFVIISWDEVWKEPEHGFLISRKYGQVKGKVTIAPDIWVKVGKSGRTQREQTLLQYNHLVKEYTDKAFKIVDQDPNMYTDEELQNIYGNIKMRGDTVKPMLAKQESAIKNRKIFENRDWYGSRKVNGVRCLIFFDGNNIRTASRGAMNYDIAIIHIITHPLIISFFKKHPNVILDGEIYKHGLSLNTISGICRSQKTVYDGKDLEFYWYDIADLELPFKERYKLMQVWSKELNLTEFNPNRIILEDELHIQLLPQQIIKGFDNMKSLHDEFVNEGWEGLVIRQADSKYIPGIRNNDWVKIKIYKDAEYEIIGLSEGLREEDMCFTLKTSSGLKFNCKPMGDVNQKHWYHEHINDLIGKMLTIKYFEMSDTGIPLQPIGIAIRDYE